MESDLEMKTMVIEQFGKNHKVSEQTNEERCKILQSLNMRLTEEKNRLEIQVQKLTAELGTKTEEFRNAVAIMKEQADSSINICGAAAEQKKT